MSRAIIYANEGTGTTSIVHPADRLLIRGEIEAEWREWIDRDNLSSTTDPELDDLWLEFIVHKDVPAGARDVRIIDTTDIPTDRTFRAALRSDLTYDMPRARHIWRAKIRAARDPILASLDIAYMRAIESNNVAEQARIASAKQALRDAPADPAIDAASTCQELKAVWPKGLESP